LFYIDATLDWRVLLVVILVLPSMSFESPLSDKLWAPGRT
jgi:hypothetical protein